MQNARPDPAFSLTPRFQAAYRALFTHHIDGKLLEEIRSASNKGMAIGSDQFKDEIEELTGRRVKAVKVGRRIGWRKNSIN